MSKSVCTFILHDHEVATRHIHCLRSCPRSGICPVMALVSQIHSQTPLLDVTNEGMRRRMRKLSATSSSFIVETRVEYLQSDLDRLGIAALRDQETDNIPPPHLGTS